MALTPEDGTIVTGADSYGTQAACTTYHANLGNTAWAALSSDEMDQAIRIATRFLDYTFAPYIRGHIYDRDQELAFPRSGLRDAEGFAWDVDEIPPDWIEASWELALVASAGELSSDGAKGGRLTKLKAGDVMLEWDENSPYAAQYAKANALIGRYLLSYSATGGRVMRWVR